VPARRKKKRREREGEKKRAQSGPQRPVRPRGILQPPTIFYLLFAGASYRCCGGEKEKGKKGRRPGPDREGSLLRGLGELEGGGKGKGKKEKENEES